MNKINRLFERTRDVFGYEWLRYPLDLESEETLTFFKTVGLEPDSVVLNITMIFPGTPLYDMAKSQGYIDDDFWLTDRPAPYFCVLEGRYSLSQLRKWVDILVYESKKQPERLIRKIRNTIDELFGIRFTKKDIEYWKRGYLKLKIKWKKQARD